ncbi:hypothetical protein Tco_1202677 [Tanacetum coccineum]
MQHFWFTIEKVKRTSYYKFEIDHKTCQIDVDTFRNILNLTLNVENQDFIQPSSSDDLKEFLLNLDYMGKLPSISEIHVDHKHQPWRTFGLIINKCLSDALITDDIKKSKAYKMFFKYSTGLIPPKKSRAKVTQATKKPAAPKKATVSPKKKITKRKLVLKDKTDDEEDLEHRPLSIEILCDVAQLEIDTLKAQKGSRHESRLQHHAGGSSEGTGSKPGVLDELTGKSTISEEGAGIQLEVPDETKNLSESHDDSDKWGSTDEEVYLVVPQDENPKSPPSDLSNNDDLNEYEDDDDERVETDDDDERVETDDDRDDKEEENDRSTDIEETDAERTESGDEHQGKGDADMNIEQEVEKEMSDEKPIGDEQATEGRPNNENKDKFEFLQPTSSQSLSSGFANQFLLNSLNASLLGTIPKPAEGDIMLGLKDFLKLLLFSTARVKLVLPVKNEGNILSSYYCLCSVSAADTKVNAAKKIATAVKG